MKIFLLTTIVLTHMMASDFIEVYSAYTNGKKIVVEGRIIDSKDKKSSSSKVFGAFFNDEKKNVAITLEVNKKKYIHKSDDEGYFLFELSNLKSIVAQQHISLHTKEKASLQNIELFYPSLEAHIGVISDFDDTVIVSNVTHKTKLLYDTFFKTYKERELVDEVEKKIKSILKSNTNRGESALFFISGSPYQLQNNMKLFLDFHAFPKRTVLTKKIHGSKHDSLFASVSYKYDKIVKLFQMYPHLKWVFFGDSGEKDPEIYLKVLKNYPNRVVDIYIRDVKSKKLNKLNH